MRGRTPGHRERLPVAAAAGDRNDGGWRIVSDLSPDLPVLDAELDAVEAFLAEALRAVLAGDIRRENPRISGALRRSDSEVPQSPETLRRRARVLEGS
ncbi:MAG: hypothetical protein F9K19_16480 [Rhizobiaceae bacterium]|nr:MAG: hypothetical protein F9K19_16480 [Rhizobiaceae bacterium]CAG1006174.1 hypothetical protein RHIZO_03240 [Rhizobiaceae bacterium]